MVEIYKIQGGCTMKKIAIITAFIIALSFLFFIWPTPYRYEKMTLAGGSTWMIRINRFDFSVEKLDHIRTGKWIKINQTAIREEPAPAPAAPSKAENLKPRDIFDRVAKESKMKEEPSNTETLTSEELGHKTNSSRSNAEEFLNRNSR